jgi:hypothetical protein
MGRTDSESAAQQGQPEIQHQIGQAMDKAQRQAGQVVEQARGQGMSWLDGRKGMMCESLGSVAQALRDSSRSLGRDGNAPVGQYAETAAEQIERVAGYLQQRDMEQLVGDAERYARRNPGVFLGGALLLGMLAARFLKSAPMDADEEGSDTSYGPSYSAYGQGYGTGAAYGAYGTPGGSSASSGSTTAGPRHTSMYPTPPSHPSGPGMTGGDHGE